MSINREIANVKAFFTSIQLHLSDEWLKSCVNWCREEVLGRHYTFEDLRSKVYEQWLVLDLRDAPIAILPSNLSSKQNFTLNGSFCLQMMQLVDISKPKLWQLQKIRNSNVLTRGTQQDADVAGTGKRLLQMTLTDGIQEIEAMEYKPINCLSLNLAPGTKVRIVGPVMIRSGYLMLETKNVKILGGDVEELSVSHAAENVLARFLKLPENPTPKAIEEKILCVERGEETNEGYVSNVTLPKNVAKKRNLNEDEDIFALPKTDYKNNVAKKLEDDEMAKEIDIMMEVEAELNQENCQIKQKVDERNDDDDDVFASLDIDAHLDQVDAIFNTNSEPIPISKLSENRENNTTHKIKAKFKSVIEKLTFAENEYKLVIEVEDASGTLKVRLHSDVIANFAQCSPSEFSSLKNSITSPDDAAVEKVMKVVIQVKNKLLELDDVMSVQLEKNRTPLVTKIS
ncbi:hypothetical protein TcasGA2_TC000159 [Tribolium castaneum]|uniref:RecQ-mediated genome instability protein 1 n=1 Tax=Tribolium castaneum TaxID=7070 RepID=D6WCR0_TRICA|nr:PREDICTED: recQ-mediated genome instability protein 1 [Tribolium castaneum]EEZ97797.2 hypothetical protein TcasGA2_TC000159 [Tribolium castaneum]|eukprot:XP_008190419.1 PREDICTED: recQ-mediated genome instability protein 1 [Tribolium castaneum]